MKVTGSLWKGKEWEDAINLHSKTSDCWFGKVYIDTSNSFMNHNYKFSHYCLMAYGNRFKKYKMKVPERYNNLIKELEGLGKFENIDKYGNRIKLD